MADVRSTNVVVRPRYGLPRFKRNACVELADGAIIATNRWGKSRRFPLSGAENSPEKSGSYFDGDRNLWWLEDSNTQLLLLVDLTGWRPVDFNEIEGAAGYPYPPASDRILPVRPDGFKVGDLPILRWAMACVAIGIGAMSLRWLHVLPELVVLAVALPALVATLWCMLLLWIARPNAEERAYVANILEHLDELGTGGPGDIAKDGPALPKQSDG